MYTVLLVDDSVPVRILIREFMKEDGGFEVVGEAGDGLEAIEMARDLQPQVVLLDLSMPRLDGLSALPRILEVAPDTRIVVYTGFVEPLAKEQALAAGAVGFLEKGTDARHILDHVRALAV